MNIQVKMWVTFNDPGLTSLAGYGYGSFPPGNVGPGSLGVDVYQVQCCQMAKFDPFLSLDCTRVEGVGAQSYRKGRDKILQRSVAEP